MNKKIAIIGITIITMLSLTACGDSKSAADDSSSIAKSSSILKTKRESSKKGSIKKANATSESKASSVAASSSAAASVKQIDLKEASKLIVKGKFTDFHPEYNYFKGSHTLSNGGYELRSYPVGDGLDIFTLMPNSDGSVKITAEYRTGADNSLLPDQSMFGPSSAIVQR
ncbi:hypothetical protein [Dellaglioa algida]|uniref:hypothetical protein n=1 Tax=Dellaglioa algida TaxID=105612 RepID=UPI0024C49F36|nr:hypothetical protein [Dellaglioa algida]MDK1727673.1 hypothetical protein [Dellaglioa algida]